MKHKLLLTGTALMLAAALTAFPETRRRKPGTASDISIIMMPMTMSSSSMVNCRCSLRSLWVGVIVIVLLRGCFLDRALHGTPVDLNILSFLAFSMPKGNS